MRSCGCRLEPAATATLAASSSDRSPVLRRTRAALWAYSRRSPHATNPSGDSSAISSVSSKGRSGLPAASPCAAAPRFHASSMSCRAASNPSDVVRAASAETPSSTPTPASRRSAADTCHFATPGAERSYRRAVRCRNARIRAATDDAASPTSSMAMALLLRRFSAMWLDRGCPVRK
eukprot:scaffold27429_cov90-Isochrysis_galbana.AAC.2